MRTNVAIDDRLLSDTFEATGLKTRREAVGEGLRLLLRLSRQAELRKLRGTIDWRSDVAADCVLLRAPTGG